MGLFGNSKKKAFDPQYEKSLSAVYFQNMETLESMWAVVTNLKAYDGDRANALEQLCYLNISDYHAWVSYNITIDPEWVRPPKCPAYIRLAMLYEKRKQYDKAVDVCCAAIRAGAVADGSSGRMFGRLARMMSKAGMEMTPEIDGLMKLQ